jgi:hypothetical protein
MGLVLPLTVGLLFAAAATIYVIGTRGGKPQAPSGDGGGGTKPVNGAPTARTDPAGTTVKDPVPTPPVPDKPRPSREDVDELMRLAGGDAKDQYKGFGGLRRMAKQGLHPDVVKQIVEHSRKLIASGTKEKIVTGIKLIEVSGDCQQGELVLVAWEENADERDVVFDARAALGNLLQAREHTRLKSIHPEWDEKRVLDQALGYAHSRALSCGADPAKWRELWKTVLAEAGQDPAGNPPPEQPGAGQP